MRGRRRATPGDRETRQSRVPLRSRLPWTNSAQSESVLELYLGISAWQGLNYDELLENNVLQLKYSITIFSSKERSYLLCSYLKIIKPSPANKSEVSKKKDLSNRSPRVKLKRATIQPKTIFAMKSTHGSTRSTPIRRIKIC